jgi:hypothetical protein
MLAVNKAGHVLTRLLVMKGIVSLAKQMLDEFKALT